MLALLLTALSGTLFIYQGQELGMVNFPLSWDMSEYKDVDSTNYYAMVSQRTANDPEELAAAKAALQHLARDHARIPLSWSAAPHAGFSPEGSKAKPWMRPNDDYKTCNAAQQQADKQSVLAFWKRALQLRAKYNDLFVHGTFDLLDAKNEAVFSFTKTWRGQRALCMYNVSADERALTVPQEVSGCKKEMLVSSTEEPKEDTLAAFEGRVFLLG